MKLAKGKTPTASDEEQRNSDSSAFGFRVRQLRAAKRLSLEDLAETSGVSRAMLSKIERGEANPTIGVAKRIAHALEISLSLLAGAEEQEHTIIVTRKAERSVFRDAVSGFERQLLSPPSSATGIELVLHVLPAAASTGMLPAPAIGTDKHVFMLAGSIEVDINGRVVRLTEGDTLFFEAAVPHAFANVGTKTARYVVFISRRMGAGR